MLNYKPSGAISYFPTQGRIDNLSLTYVSFRNKEVMKLPFVEKSRDSLIKCHHIIYVIDWSLPMEPTFHANFHTFLTFTRTRSRLYYKAVPLEVVLVASSSKQAPILTLVSHHALICVSVAQQEYCFSEFTVAEWLVVDRLESFKMADHSTVSKDFQCLRHDY